ncbi:MAG TPA: hypothetical protein VL981_06660 [Candidatus Methylacidiphilales bacterium]|nr:hypothetical protein [Candidatus Methylacidiphilales bacterium]
MAMRWPEIFFKAKPPPSREKTPETNTPASHPASVIATIKSPAPKPAPTLKSINDAMEEADTLRVLTRSGGIRFIKRIPAENTAEITAATLRAEAMPVESSVPPPEATPELKSGPAVQPPAPSVSELGKMEKEPSAATPPQAAPESKKSDLAPEPPAPAMPKPTETEKKFSAEESPDVTASEQSPTSTSKSASDSRYLPLRRKGRLTDLARIILPAKRENPPATIVPPSFPVEVPAGTVLRVEEPKPVKDVTPSASGVSPLEKTPEPPPGKPAEPISGEKAAPEPGEKSEIKQAAIAAESPSIPESEKKPEPVPAVTEKAFTSETKTEPAAAKPEAAPSSPKPLSMPLATDEKREFLLTNGERIFGKVLSETPDAIYLEHLTLGVLTLPRAQIAKRLMELILINGDRIVGDIVAETPECLFVRHASLGMLTVPQTQRSTRVVEAILKDGDRIVGEVLAETDTYTVIRSAALGTVTVQHRQLAMLNRKVEQVALKALPPSPPALENKPSP